MSSLKWRGLLRTEQLKLFCSIEAVKSYPLSPVSRYKSSNSSSLSLNVSYAGCESDYHNYVCLARDLANQNPIKYSLLRDLELKLPPLTPLKSDPRENLVEDWNDINEIATEFGTPEFADHMSGHVYMQGTIHEDKTSKGVRVAELIPRLKTAEIFTCLQHCQKWRLETVRDSHTLQVLVAALDKELLNRLKSDIDTKESVMKAGILSCFNLLKVKESLTLHKIVHDCQKTKDHPVLYLLMAAFLNKPLVDQDTVIKDLILEIEASFDQLTSAELAVSISGLKALSQDDNSVCDPLKTRIENRFGFRLSK